MSPLIDLALWDSLGFPRSRGDEPVTDAATDFIRWFSPLTRG